MKTIWKFPLEVTDFQHIKVPKGYRILTVRVQYDRPTLWAMVDPNETDVGPVEIRIFGTGHPMPDDPGRYIGTFQMSGGSLVFHVFGPE
jgi:hypothetical protein